MLQWIIKLRYISSSENGVPVPPPPPHPKNSIFEDEEQSEQEQVTNRLIERLLNKCTDVACVVRTVAWLRGVVLVCSERDSYSGSSIGTCSVAATLHTNSLEAMITPSFL
jgi:hypothetical protein